MKLWPFKKSIPSRLPRFCSTGLEIRAQDWRKNPALLTTAQRITGDVGFLQMLECLRTENPANFAFPLIDVPTHARAAYQSKIEGWNACVETMLSLSKPVLEDTASMEEDYGVEEPQPNTNHATDH